MEREARNEGANATADSVTKVRFRNWMVERRTEEKRLREPIFRAELIDPFSLPSRNPDEPHPNHPNTGRAHQLAARLR